MLRKSIADMKLHLTGFANYKVEIKANRLCNSRARSSEIGENFTLEIDS